MGVASRSRTAFTLADVSLELEAALTVSHHPIAFSTLMGFSWVFVELVGDMLGRTTLVIEDDVFLNDMGVHSRGDVSRVRMSQIADDEIVSCELFSRCEK